MGAPRALPAMSLHLNGIDAWNGIVDESEMFSAECPTVHAARDLGDGVVRWVPIDGVRVPILHTACTEC